MADCFLATVHQLEFYTGEGHELPFSYLNTLSSYHLNTYIKQDEFMRRNILIAVIVIALLAAGYYFLRQQQQSSQEPAFEILREATAENGRITATVNATGAIEPEALVSLTFGNAGTVSQVNVVRGQPVQAGDVLATLNTAELELAVQQAQDALTIQELTLQQRLNSQPSQATLASAQADIQAAQAQLAVAQANVASAEAAVLQATAQRNKLLEGPSEGQIAQAELQVANAQLQQENAQQTYNQVTECFDPPGGGDPVCPGLGAPEEQARAALENANAGLSAAQSQLADLLAGASAADIQGANAAIASAEAGVQAAQGNVAAAEANIARAEAALARLQEPPGEDEIAILEAQVESGRTNLAITQLRLEQSRIVASMNGTIANVLIDEGEQTSPGAPAITLVNEGAFHISVNVDEIDIDRVAIGQAVDITLDALPDVPVTGSIADIAPTSTNAGGVVTYLVMINIEETDEVELKPGMSATAAIVVEEIDNVLIVPNWAVRLDRETGEAFVNVKRTTADLVTVEEVVVETGLRNEQFSEVVSGLQAGDVVVVTNERETFNLFGGGE